MSGMRPLTLSALERIEACPTSGGTLPTYGTTTAEASAGTANHDREEAALREGHEASEAVEKFRAGAVWVESEVAMAIHPGDRTARLLGRGLGRDYGELRDGEIAGTIDGVALHPSKLVIADWKSRARVTPASRNIQVRAAAVGIMAMAERPFAEASGLPVEVAIGYLDDGYVDAELFDAFAVEETWRRLATLQARARDASVDDIHVGPWCKYCPSLAYCPAQNALMRSAIGEAERMANEVALMCIEDVGKARIKLKVIQRLVDVVDKAIHDRAHQEPIPLGDGKWLMRVESSRRGFDKDAAIARLAAAGLSTDDLATRSTFISLRETTRKPARDDEEAMRKP